MNKELSFRGKHGDEWIYGWLIKDKTNTFYIARGIEIGTWYRVEKDTIGQYTGLTDKNGRKIFEGDIVNYTIGKPNGDSVDIEKEVVKFDYMQLVQLEHSSYLKVVGNIYEDNLESQV